ncbi:LexA family transcriptional regulator [Latilactobacillus curvatus]|uniref:XRE family transcriptional regulator n=1 Tax=Latilactobacillus curvatus TaxID=28038 RepID=UPI00202F0B7E|nr:XRE family transcriptional regulator [Latilactobacillus curvatus]MCM0724347.1 XRE family transcriptional regulator [Latilactobacillus curvatus]MCT3528194.1 LexA family transcriptional regulator [Latilactobacillus curvatus]
MAKDITEIFSNNLNKLMESRGENLTVLSNQLDVSFSTVSDWKHGKKMPRSGSLQKIAEHYNVALSYLTTDHSDNLIISGMNEYNYFDAGLSAGVLNDVDPFTANDVETIGLSDVIMGKYAGDKDIFITYINGESMNRIIPDGSLIAVKQYTDFSELCDGDIVVFQEGAGMAVKRFYNDIKNKIVTFTPDSTSGEFRPINYLYDSMSDVRIIGKVVVYTVTV